MNMKQHHFQSDESCHFPLLCKGNTTSAHPAAGGQLPISAGTEVGSGTEALATGVPTDGWRAAGGGQGQDSNLLPSPPPVGPEDRSSAGAAGRQRCSLGPNH